MKATSPRIRNGRIFLDICPGFARPWSAAISANDGDVFSFEILLHSEDDLLNDSTYEELLRLSSGGIVAYGCGSPSCIEYTRLKLRPNGPRAIRAPEHLNGIPNLSQSEQRRIHSSFTMPCRTVMILTSVHVSGGHVHLEQPQNAMSWLEAVVQSYLRHIAPFCVILAARGYGANCTS